MPKSVLNDMAVYDLTFHVVVLKRFMTIFKIIGYIAE